MVTLLNDTILDAAPGTPKVVLTGTASQIEWAEQIRPQVQAEFDRVAKAFETAAEGQAEPDRGETLTIIEILEEKRAEVMAKSSAGYFIRDWRELKDQVRQLIAEDPRFRSIRISRAERQAK